MHSKSLNLIARIAEGNTADDPWKLLAKCVLRIEELEEEVLAKTCSSFCHPDEPCSITEDGKCDLKSSV